MQNIGQKLWDKEDKEQLLNIIMKAIYMSDEEIERYIEILTTNKDSSNTEYINAFKNFVLKHRE